MWALSSFGSSRAKKRRIDSISIWNLFAQRLSQTRPIGHFVHFGQFDAWRNWKQCQHFSLTVPCQNGRKGKTQIFAKPKRMCLSLSLSFFLSLPLYQNINFNLWIREKFAALKNLITILVKKLTEISSRDAFHISAKTIEHKLFTIARISSKT